MFLFFVFFFLIIQSQAAFVNCLYVARFTIVHSKTQIKFPLLLLLLLLLLGLVKRENDLYATPGEARYEIEVNLPSPLDKGNVDYENDAHWELGTNFKSIHVTVIVFQGPEASSHRNLSLEKGKEFLNSSQRFHHVLYQCITYFLF